MNSSNVQSIHYDVAFQLGQGLQNAKRWQAQISHAPNCSCVWWMVGRPPSTTKSNRTVTVSATTWFAHYWTPNDVIRWSGKRMRIWVPVGSPTTSLIVLLSASFDRFHHHHACSSLHPLSPDSTSYWRCAPATPNIWTPPATIARKVRRSAL